MMTWRMWQALVRPPADHPLYQRVLREETASTLLGRGFPFTTTIAMIAGFIVPATMLIIFFQAPPLFPFFVALGFNLLCLRWIIGAVRTIARERRRGIYDLLCLAPFGVSGALWVMTAAALQRRKLFGTIAGIVTVSRTTALVIPAIFILALLFGGSRLSTYGLWLFNQGSVLLFIAVDFVQTVVLCITAVIAVSSLRSGSMETLLGTLALFLAVQIVVYALTLRVDLASSTAFLDLLVPLAVLVVTRELLIWLIWRGMRALVGPDITHHNVLTPQS